MAVIAHVVLRGVSPAQYDAVRLIRVDIALAAWKILHVPGVHEDDLKAACVEDFEHGDPVDARGFHRDVRHPAGRQPVREPVQIAREGGEHAHRCRVAIGRDSDEVFGRSTVDPRHIGMETFEGSGRRARLGGRTATMAFHRRLLSTGDSLWEQGCG